MNGPIMAPPLTTREKQQIRDAKSVGWRLNHNGYSFKWEVYHDETRIGDGHPDKVDAYRSLIWCAMHSTQIAVNR